MNTPSAPAVDLDQLRYMDADQLSAIAGQLEFVARIAAVRESRIIRLIDTLEHRRLALTESAYAMQQNLSAVIDELSRREHVD